MADLAGTENQKGKREKGKPGVLKGKALIRRVSYAHLKSALEDLLG